MELTVLIASLSRPSKDARSFQLPSASDVEILRRHGLLRRLGFHYTGKVSHARSTNGVVCLSLVREVESQVKIPSRLLCPYISYGG